MNALPRLLCALFVSLSLAPWSPSAAQLAAPVKYDLSYDIFRPVRAEHGMVVSEQKLASQIGVDILKQGGNAVDAAVAVGFALAVVLPSAGNLAGGGFMLIHDAQSGRDVALDFREMAPARASRDMYLDNQGQVVAGRSLDSHQAVGIPGSVAGLVYALDHYGSLKRAQVMAPAIRLARQGYTVSDELAAQLAAQAARLGRWPASKAIFFQDGQPLRAGQRLVQKDLAASLSLIARHGPDAFYRGAIARRIAAEMAAHGGLIGLDDLGRYRVVERPPVLGDYRGYRIVAMPPPSSGGAHIVQILNILQRYPLRQWGAGSAQALHLEAEAMKLAYADRAEYLGDPDFSRVPVAGLTAPAYADQLAQKIDPDHATPASAIRAGQPQPFESDQTTHYSVADSRGNVVSTTYTLNLAFGSAIVVPGTGILLNNEMDDFVAKPGVANAFGLVGGAANAIAPYKRPLSSMAPTLVLKDGKPWLVTGSPGGSRIISTTLQTLINVIDHDMNPAEAGAAPRIHHQWTPDELRVEKGFSPDTLALLRQKGHQVVVRPTMGRSQTIQILPSGFYGYSDPRNPDGASVGY